MLPHDLAATLVSHPFLADSEVEIMLQTGSTSPTSTTSATPASPPRSGRLRGLSYLRNYTHNHLHLRPNTAEPDASTDRASRPRLNRAATEDSPPSSSHTSERDTRPHRSNHRRHIDRALPNTSRTPSPLQADGWLPASGVSAGSAGPATQIETALSASQAGMVQHDGQALDLPADLSSTAASETKKRSRSTKPTIQFIPYNDISSRSRPSLDFARISRTLPQPTSVIKVGRYSERDSNIECTPSQPSESPVGFKSKVVSRKHCEFWCEGEQWYVKDVGSSSGTFLNHVRLSPPALESKPFLIRDGDIIQLGIDFKGGEEMIFRCVKMRLECNRGWQKTVNKFNKSTHKQLRNLTRANGDEMKPNEASRSSTECTICLNSIAPCQALFVAPCSHTWHFKCIRKLLEAPPIHEFTCPNCRAQAYLNADVEEPEGYAESIESVPSEADQTQQVNDLTNAESPSQLAARTLSNQTEFADEVGDLRLTDDDDPMLLQHIPSPPPEHAAEHSDEDMSEEGESEEMASTPQASAPVNIPRPAGSTPSRAASGRARTPSASASHSLAPDVLNGEGPLTPRNNAGPFVFDGSADDPAAQRAASTGRNEMTNLNSIV
ncbi:hypothetical protein FH972_022812 [Carpinus fangiana]|uniref:FHA domain-containing protein n=1 Tax=Carpinus fangiana TaxID=176857 RepID=A0A5N6KTN2_9ROSI|nr:hypothetical protein FH972_022812 [Carpinus fangiana]